MRSLVLVILLLVALSATTSVAAETRGLRVVAKDPATNQSSEVRLYNKSYAIIIGIDKYLNLPPDRQLQNAVKDAQGVHRVLTKYYQFDRVVTLYNEQATKDRILEVLTEEFPAQMGKDDALFVFWAGHGNQEASDYGDLGYLIPFDGSVDKIRKNLTMSEIRDTISKKIPAKHVLYVMDACYSGLLTSRSVDAKTRRDLAYLKQITRESVRQVLTAGSKGEEALDGGPKGHSVFTGRFIEILESAGDFITANELQAYIKERVYSDAKARNHSQTPGFGPLYGMGDFVFIPKQADKLGDLAGESLARQKELEQLKRMEIAADEAKKKEQAEIAKKESEVAALDKQIAEMKGRLGTGAAQGGDSLDQIIALAEQQEAQGNRLEELRRQRETEERNRREEIERLKREAATRKADQLKADIAKYQKVANSKYAQSMKGSAWDALVAAHPEAANIERYDVAGLLATLNGEEGADPPTRKKQAKEQPRPSGDDMVRVNGAAITRTDLDRAVKVMMAQNKVQQPVAPEILRQAQEAALEQLTSAELLYQEASKLEIEDLDQQVAARIAESRAKFASEQEFGKSLESVDMTLKDLKEYTRRDIVINKFIEKRFAAKSAVSETEARKFYDENLEKYFKKPESVRASHILVGSDDKSSREERRKAEKKAEALLKRVRAGEDFAAIAKSDSTCPSASQGGDLGNFGRGQMVPAFEKAAFALDVGQISDVVETQFGYHIVKLTGKQEMTTEKFDDVKAKIMDFVKREKTQKDLAEWLAELRKAASIQKIATL